MKTLLVDCYRQDSEQKLAGYRRLCAEHSEVHDVLLARLGPGFDLAGFDAVVLSGSQWMLTSEEPAEGLTAFIRSLRLPTLGICFGHQLLARSFGATIARGELIERDEAVEVRADWPLFAGLAPSCTMRESHREFVTAESVRDIGWPVGARSASCPVEAIRHPELPLFGVQFHPERSAEPGKQLFANFYRLAGPQLDTLSRVTRI